MNNKLSHVYLIVSIAAVSACRGPVKENETQAATSTEIASHPAAEKYTVDTKESVVIYMGSMVLASKGQHSGYVYLSKGELLVENDQLVGGTVDVDMNTLVDQDHGSDNELVRHLKSADFFNVEKFPSATFAITRVESAADKSINVTGNLTIKGITHAVTFPVKTEVTDELIKANGKLVIDRTLWDVRYSSGKFYADLADEAISDSIEFEIKIIARK